jgi:hypothetical protein
MILSGVWFQTPLYFCSSLTGGARLLPSDAIQMNQPVGGPAIVNAREIRKEGCI